MSLVEKIDDMTAIVGTKLKEVEQKIPNNKAVLEQITESGGTILFRGSQIGILIDDSDFDPVSAFEDALK